MYLAAGVLVLVGIVILWGWWASVRQDQPKKFPKIPH
jgi:hypothetical protein